jgi:hypothetical protein
MSINDESLEMLSAMEDCELETTAGGFERITFRSSGAQDFQEQIWFRGNQEGITLLTGGQSLTFSTQRGVHATFSVRGSGWDVSATFA